MTELKLADFGLETTEHAAERRGQSQQTIRNLVASGELPAVVIGAGRSARYLVRPEDVDAIPIRGRGAPSGNANALKKPKPRKAKRK